MDRQQNDPKEKGQKDRQRSTKHYIENHRKDRARDSEDENQITNKR